MDRVSSLLYPGSKILAGWWRQLQPHHPTVIQVGYAFVHRVDAPIIVRRNEAIDSFTQLILQAIALESTAEHCARFDHLNERLRVPAPILRQVLAVLCGKGLLTASTDAWQLTDSGRVALVDGSYPTQTRERRSFPFIERLQPSGQRGQPPLFLPFAECPAVPWQVDVPYRFEPAWLDACLTQSPQWKERWAFPLNVQPVTDQSSVPDWEQVIVDRPERSLLVLVQTAHESRRDWLVFAVKADGWQFCDQAPVMLLPIDQEEQPLALAEPASSAMLTEGWRAWCRERNFPMNEVELCELNYQSPRLEVRAPERFLQRLRAAKSDLLKGEAWLLIGDGYLRTAVLLTLASAA